ncbi:MAG: hypothetical protein V1809_09720 [Planctomycetota bacterium]
MRLGMVVVCVCVAGCMSQKYSIIVRNTGSEKITHASVNYNDFKSGGGNLLPGGGAQHAWPDEPIPEKAKVVWRDAKGVDHEKDVEVKKNIPKNIRGDKDLIFEIGDNDDVTMKVKAVK